MPTPDLRRPADDLAALVRGTRDDQLAGPTPCPAYTVADLLDHVDGLALAFTAAARKERLPADVAGPSVDGSRLGEAWRERIEQRLADLAAAWTDPAAFDGMTQAGPVDLPAPVAALVALDEVTLHAWDLAVATGQAFEPDPDAVAACQSFVDSFEPPPDAVDAPANTGELFGPPVAVPPGAPALHRLLGVAGRDPHWRPA